MARLARLELSREELELYSRQLGDVLDHAAALSALDLSKVPPMSHPLPLENVLREDVVEDCLDTTEVLDAAPSVVDGRFAVPRILEEADSVEGDG